MKNLISNLLTLLPICLFLVLFACSAPTDTSLTDANSFELLKDRNLEEWEKIGQFDALFHDGVLSFNNSAGEGWFVSKRSFKNFLLETEFTLDPDANSGIAIRIPENTSGDFAKAAYEINLSQNPEQQAPTGSIIGAARGIVLDSLDTTNWNKMAIEAKGDLLTVLINDQVVVQTHDNKSSAGKIALQVGKAQFKNLKVEKIPDSLSVASQITEEIRKGSEGKLETILTPENYASWDQRGTAKWDYKDDILHAYSGESGGFLVSPEAYKDFHLKLQFKIDKEHNSGIFIRHNPDSTNIGLETAIECNIYDHNGYAHAYSTGSIVTYARAFRDLVDYGEWNTMEIIAIGDHVRLYINDQKSAEHHFEGRFAKAGNICLQGGIMVFNDNKPSDIWFKEVQLRKL